MASINRVIWRGIGGAVAMGVAAGTLIWIIAVRALRRIIGYHAAVSDEDVVLRRVMRRPAAAGHRGTAHVVALAANVDVGVKILRKVGTGEIGVWVERSQWESQLIGIGRGRIDVGINMGRVLVVTNHAGNTGFRGSVPPTGIVVGR